MAWPDVETVHGVDTRARLVLERHVAVLKMAMECAPAPGRVLSTAPVAKKENVTLV